LMSFYANANLTGQQGIRGAAECAYVLTSPDGGRTWGKPVLIAPRFNETVLADLRDGRLVAALRSEGSESYVAISFSPDKGGTWTEPRRVTEADEHPADLLVLADGRLLLTYGERNRPYGVRALVSADEGVTWERDKGFILAWDARNRDCGYPSSVQLEDGRIVTVYYQVDDQEKAPQSVKARAVIWRVER
jgi:Neuraminidase (sialidase)